MTEQVTTVETKPFYKSKIVWLAVATIFLGATDELTSLGNLLPAEYQGLFTIMLGAATLIARAYSGTQITVKK